MSSNQGRFTWYELLTTDPGSALDYYAELTGWTHQRWETTPPPGADPTEYHVWMRGEQPLAGCMELPAMAQEQGAPTHWLGYIHCDDLAATKARAIELGAHELVAMEFPEIGKVAIMHDPQHAVIGFFQPNNEPGPEAPPSLGDFSWHELMAADFEAAYHFYSELFGWEIIDDMDMGEAGIYRMYGRNGHMLGGIFNKPAEMPAAAWMYYVKVANCAEAAKAITAGGGTVAIGPMEVPGGDHIVQGIDPQGGRFALHSSAPATAEA